MKNKKRLFHLLFSDLSNQEFLDSINQDIINKHKSYVCTPNLDFLRTSYKDLNARIAFNNADYCTIDGQIVFLLSKIFHSGIKHKFSGSDMADPVCNLANDNNYRLFLFGGLEGVAELAAQNIVSKYPNVQICGTYCPPFKFEQSEEETDKIINMLIQSQPDIVFLCCGSPKTEKFYYSNKSKLPNAVYFCIGATIDFLAGNISRAPKWMSKCGLEWLYRLSKDFKRLFKRYFLDGMFLIKIFFVRIFRKKKLIRMIEESYEKDCN